MNRKPAHMPGIDEKTEAYLIAHKRPLSRREYEALKGLMASAACLARLNAGMETRLKECVPWGWRDARMLHAKTKKLFDKLLLTIPIEKLKMIKSEMPHLDLYIRVGGAAVYDPDDDDNVMIPRNTLKALSEYATQQECLLCAKRDKAVKNCRLRKILNDTFPHSVPTFGPAGECIYSTYEPDGHDGWEGLEDKVD